MLQKLFKLGLSVGGVALAVGAAAPAGAVVIQNGGFEAFPDFANWNTLGNTSIQDTNFKPPTEGTVQALLSNGSNGPGASAATTNIAGLDSFMNLGPGSLEASNIKSGSAIKQGFSGVAGDVIKFSYDYLTNEVVTVRADWALYTIAGAAFQSGTLGLPDDAGLHNTSALDDASGFFVKETGYRTFTYTLPATGAYTLSLAVTNAVDTTITSGLLVDNVTQNGSTGPGSPVPLPAGMYLMPFGLLAAGYTAKRMRRTVAC